MTESEWLTSSDPKTMLAFLTAAGKVHDRKHRLFTTACCRSLWHLLSDKPYRYVVDVGERFIDGLASAGDRAAAEDEVLRIAMWGLNGHDAGPLWDAGWYLDPTLAANHCSDDPDSPACLVRTTVLADAKAGAETCVNWATALGLLPTAQATILRDIMHAPFRPVHFRSPWRRWNEGTLVRLAANVYEQRRLPDGILDPAAIAVLGDACEDAGVGEADILNHLRGPGPHYLGCWVLDLLLGKS